jgi:hypothetical protein
MNTDDLGDFDHGMAPCLGIRRQRHPRAAAPWQQERGLGIDSKGGRWPGRLVVPALLRRLPLLCCARHFRRYSRHDRLQR